MLNYCSFSYTVDPRLQMKNILLRPAILFFIARLSFFVCQKCISNIGQCMSVGDLGKCPLLRGWPLFGESLIRGSTVLNLQLSLSLGSSTYNFYPHVKIICFSLDLWLKYISMELHTRGGDVGKVGSLHWRAMKTLEPSLTGSFLEQYSLIQTTGSAEHSTVS